MRKNVASQTVSFQAISTTDGSDVTTGTPTVYYTIDGGTQGTGAGTSAHEGNGQWSYVPAQAETNGDHVAFTQVLTGAVSQTVNVWPVSFDPTTADLGLENVSAADVNAQCDTAITDAALATAAALATVDTVVDGIQTDLSNATDGLGAIKTAVDSRMAEASINTTAGAIDNVTLVATTTTNTDMRGTDNAATEAKQDIIDGIVDDILVDTGTTLPASIAALTEPAGIVKNAGCDNFEFPMVLTSDHYTAATSKTVTGEMSIDGAAFVSTNGTIAEVSDGVYQIDMTAADTNGDKITYKFSATDCDDTIISVITRS